MSLDVLYIHTVTHRGWIDYGTLQAMHIVLRRSHPQQVKLRVSLRKTLQPGLISEVVYREDQPMMTQLLLLPLLQQLGQQSRWQLWLTPQQKLSREWVQASGLPLTKVMQISQPLPLPHWWESMVRALRTGNYSVVIGLVGR
ncbi:SOS cell division inhibitor [Escherichia coli]|uniref:SOS cell division inhibitor n=1 Tax=Escherichia coli TaxID=562 RepID=A0A2X3K1S2_ECOLX|nr:SOS cell division inhibitor [Escherichia coli]